MSTYPNSPTKLPCSRLAGVALLALLGCALIHRFPERKKAPWFAEKVHATTCAHRAILHIAKTYRGQEIEGGEVAYRSTGLIGRKSSIITSDRGYLRAKIASINPHFAAVIVELLHRAEVRKGEVVAVALSGSFPALNICVHAALQALQLQPLIITSATASNWGANDPEFCWLDMEQRLLRSGFFSTTSHLVSIGGDGDCGTGLSPVGISCLMGKIAQYQLPFLQCRNTHQSIERRLAFYRARAASRPLAAYINVGGGVASVSRREKHLFRPGLNRDSAPISEELHDSVMVRLAKERVPLVHLIKVRELAESFGLRPSSALSTRLKWSGKLYFSRRYSSKWAAFVLAFILLGLTWVTRSQRTAEELG